MYLNLKWEDFDEFQKKDFRFSTLFLWKIALLYSFAESFFFELFFASPLVKYKLY